MAKAMVLIADGVEDLEFFYPKIRLEEAGFEVLVVGELAQEYETKHGYKVDAQIASINDALECSVLIIPGGTAPDKLRQDPQMLEITREMVNAGKIVGAICHGPLVLVSAKVVEGRTMTSWPGIKDDLVNAGADWIDMPVVRDRNMVTSRKPDDLSAFMEAICSMAEVARLYPEGQTQ